jgi:hypothetical protein
MWGFTLSLRSKEGEALAKRKIGRSSKEPRANASCWRSRCANAPTKYAVGAKHERDYLWDLVKGLHPLMLRPTPKRYQQTNPKTYPQKGASWWGKTPHQFANSIL